ncbi:MAG: hypothetical protein IT564_12315 [Rhodospirillales bacterium]|nr:hypothetical protein [Rhodospirillales bacterium]
MRHWDLDTSGAQLRDALQDLQRAWQVVSESWNDSVSRQFCEQHLEPLIPASKMALDATSRMRELLMRAQMECEE